MINHPNPAVHCGRIFCLHGYPGQPSDLLPIAKGLNGEIEVLEMPWLDQGTDPISIEAIVSALAEDLCGAPAHIIGHDLGAAIGWIVAHAYPDRVRSLTIIGTPRLDSYVAHWDIMEAKGYTGYRNTLETHDPTSPLPNQENLTQTETENGIGQLLAERRLLSNPAKVAAIYRELAHLNVPARTALTDPPLLVLLGDEDPYIMKEILQKTSVDRTNRSRQVIVKGAGHWLLHTHVSDCLAAITPFLQENS